MAIDYDQLSKDFEKELSKWTGEKLEEWIKQDNEKYKLTPVEEIIKVLVIEEFDLVRQETDIIGVADSVDKAVALINKHYGDHKELSLHDLDTPNVEWRKVIEVDGETKWVTLHWFTLNGDDKFLNQ